MCNTPNYTGLYPDSALFNSSVFPAYPLHIFPSFPALIRVEPSAYPTSPSPDALQRLIYAKPVFNRREIEKHLKGDFEVLSGPNGAYGIRTRDLNTASVARSQLR